MIGKAILVSRSRLSQIKDSHMSQQIKGAFFTFPSAAWVHRGFTDDVTEVQQIQPGGDKLSDFQKDKFRHFFTHVLDLNSDYVISAEDFDKLNEVGASITRLLTLPKAVGLKCSSNEGIIKNILKTRYIKFTLLH